MALAGLTWVGRKVIFGAAKALIGAAVKCAVAVTSIVLTASAIKSVAQSKSKEETKAKDDTKKNKNNNSVYVLMDKKEVKYVGRTTNVEERKRQHKNNPYKKNLEMVILETEIPYGAARVKEQELIIKYRTLNPGNCQYNQINGLSFHNKNIKEYIKSYNEFFDEEVYVGVGWCNW